jgi:hypothetical protein
VLAERGDLDQLRARADTGDEHAIMELLFLLRQHEDLYEAEQLLRDHADVLGPLFQFELAELLAEKGDVDQLRTQADARGGGHAARRLADVLADRGDLDEAEQVLRGLADAGDGDAGRLAELLTARGRGEEAERLRRFGLLPDGSAASG